MYFLILFRVLLKIDVIFEFPNYGFLVFPRKNVKIKFTGLRDGEKLFEEVLNDTEQTKPTIHPKIKIASVREYQFSDALKNEEELLRLSFTYDDMDIVRKMKEIVPEYKSRQSKYEVLDK